MLSIATVAQDSQGGSNWLVYLLFIVAGLLVGATWSAYQSGSRPLTIFLALCSAVAFAGAVFWMMGAMG
ncbi:hypothetical protein SAMN06295981_0458 [Corynebacterium pollutisoli]|uniref:Uncharacterized protein n=1 Tax=Corynebacterium pollutisoli TaxID=1610489 RepID=A0A1X7I5Z4_9CORY|nr:hypothetical protein [Corynebacterium pollutisoli]SMG09905.1 hypothetical protein SAMN06295981_0458 [Corynebacterium pollutisoli]